MSKTLQIAWREFLVTVSSKAFLIGLLLAPAIGTLFVLIMPRIMSSTGFEAEGTVALIDLDGRVADELLAVLDPDALAAGARARAEAVLERMPDSARALVAREALERAASGIELALDVRPATADPDSEKARLHAAPPNERPLALVVIHENAVEPSGGEPGLGAYDLFVPPRLDDRIEDEIRRGVREAIVTARISARGYDPAVIRALVDVPRPRAVSVSADDERGASRGFTFMLPLAFGLLLFLGVLGGGQALLTSTVEEKSSRVIEVLLSAVSPMQLMAGKLLGQMAVSIVALSLYIGLGLAVLAGFALIGLLDLALIVYLALFFVISYLVIGSLMMAIGSAVNDMREAQTLMTPLMLVIMSPMFLWFPISRDPDSTLSLVLSLAPPVNGFAMLLRMASVSPPPSWQVWLSIAIGIASVFAALWFAAKVFRIGLLMHGKPPNLLTLFRWARAA